MLSIEPPLRYTISLRNWRTNGTVLARKQKQSHFLSTHNTMALSPPYLYTKTACFRGDQEERTQTCPPVYVLNQYRIPHTNAV
jgi:hypothetical protein